MRILYSPHAIQKLLDAVEGYRYFPVIFFAWLNQVSIGSGIISSLPSEMGNGKSKR